MAFIQVEQVAQAMRHVREMDPERKVERFDEIHTAQPTLLYRVVANRHMGASLEEVGRLLDILLVCFEVLYGAGLRIRTLSEDELEACADRVVQRVQTLGGRPARGFSTPALGTYLNDVGETHLFTCVANESKGFSKAEPEAAKHLGLTALVLVEAVSYLIRDAQPSH